MRSGAIRNQRHHVASRLLACCSAQGTRRKPRIGPADELLQATPIKAGSRIMLAPRRDVLMPNQLRNRVVLRNGLHQLRQGRVLRSSEACAFQSFQLDADGVVVALAAPIPTGCASMPGAIVATHELQHAPVAPHHEMRRNLQAANALEIRVCLKVQRVGKELLDLWPAVFARRQADGMQHQQINGCACRTRPEVGAGYALRQAAPTLLPLRRRTHAASPLPPRCPDAPCGSESGAGSNPTKRPPPCG